MPAVRNSYAIYCYLCVIPHPCTIDRYASVTEALQALYNIPEILRRNSNLQIARVEDQVLNNEQASLHLELVWPEGILNPNPITEEQFNIEDEAAEAVTTERIDLVDLDIENKRKILASVPVNTDFLYNLRELKVYNAPANRQGQLADYWDARAKTLWEDLIMSLPITEWQKEQMIVLDASQRVLKVRFREAGESRRSANMIRRFYMYSLGNGSMTVDAAREIVESIPLRRGFALDTEWVDPDNYAWSSFRIRGASDSETRIAEVIRAIARNSAPTVNYRTNGGTISSADLVRFISWILELPQNFRALYSRELENLTETVSFAASPKKNDRYSEVKFSDFIQKRRTGGFLKDAYKDNIATLPIPEHGYLSSRQWGIEVESGGARGVDAPYNWDRTHDGSLESAYGNDNYDDNPDTIYVDPLDCDSYDHAEMITDHETGVMVENPEYADPDYCDYCGEVDDPDWEENEPDDYSDCAEFVSPILKSYHSKGLEKLVRELAEQPQNDSAGIHVHVDAAGLTPKQIGGLVFGYEMIEPLIEASYYRETRSYCKPREPYETLEIIKQAKKATYTARNGGHYIYEQHGDGDMYLGDRYVSLNLVSLGVHGTLEFRAMGPLYKYEHLIRWAHFCREMVNLAAANVTQKEWRSIRSFADLTALFAKYGKEYAPIELAKLKCDNSLLELLEV